MSYILREVEVNSTSLIRFERIKPVGNTRGELIAGGGVEYPCAPLEDVFGSVGSIPFALSIAMRSLPGIGGAEG